MRRPLFSLGALALAMATPVAASADVFGTRQGTSPRTTRVDAVLIDGAGAGHAWVEQLTLTNEEPQIVWLRPFSRPPEVSPGPSLVAPLARSARHRPELSDSLRDNPFGPSVLTLVASRLDPEEPARGPDLPPDARSLSIDAVGVFSGPAQTSTRTGEVSLPPDLQDFLRRRDARLTNAQRGQLAYYLGVGWSVFAAALYDESPSADRPARIGPLRFEFDDDAPTYPLLRRTADASVELHFYTLADGPRVPGELPASVAREPDGAAPDGTVRVRHAAPLEADPDLMFELLEQRELPLSPSDHYVRSALRPGVAQLDELSFVAPEAASTEVALPAPSRRGGAVDVFLCLLLGMTPLVLTPESWLLRWFQSRAREGARRGGSRFGVKLWAFWALAVAAYWFFSLDGLTRVAAIGPLLVGTLQLMVPFVERESGPVRVQFKKKKKKKSPKGGGKAKTGSADPSDGKRSAVS